jgi:hypothetical protein
MEQQRPVRFALATFAPTLGVLSVAATARNIYLAPALPGAALLLGWWVSELSTTQDHWDVRAMRGTSFLLLLAVIVLAAAVTVLGLDSWDVLNARILYVAVSVLGLASALACALLAWHAAGRGLMLRASFGLLLAYSALLVGPASQIYRRVDAWQDLGSIGRAIGRDTDGRPVILFAPDETTRAFIDMYTRTSVGLIPGPVTAQSAERLRAQLVTQLPGRNYSRTFRELAARLGVGNRSAPPLVDDAETPAWASGLQLRIAHRYALPNGRRYALLAGGPATASR